MYLATANRLAQWNLYHPDTRPGQSLPYYDTIEFDNNGNFVEPPPRSRSLRRPRLLDQNTNPRPT
ncbi:hypothetical protein N7449_007037 [Penicillium cf. viridicatum]|uniref:Uncharacterized protein n=1 Tax=Penicillium cf. viridicatum TaxID=2972119 RepID=A0A9W9JGL1_9EURO|nr:hypothetical protein N7449_007037 [Penicillium cf. viridicatum]